MAERLPQPDVPPLTVFLTLIDGRVGLCEIPTLHHLGKGALGHLEGIQRADEAHDVNRSLRFPAKPHGLFPVLQERVVEDHGFHLRVSRVPVTFVRLEHHPVAELHRGEASLNQLEGTRPPGASFGEESPVPLVELIRAKKGRCKLRKHPKLNQRQAVGLRKGETNSVFAYDFEYCLIRNGQERVPWRF